MLWAWDLNSECLLSHSCSRVALSGFYLGFLSDTTHIKALGQDKAAVLWSLVLRDVHDFGSRASPPWAAGFCAPLGNHTATSSRCEIKLCHLSVQGSPVTVQPRSKDNRHLKKVLQEASEPPSLSPPSSWRSWDKGSSDPHRGLQGILMLKLRKQQHYKKISLRSLSLAERQAAWSRLHPHYIMINVMKSALVWELYLETFWCLVENSLEDFGTAISPSKCCWGD